MECRGGWEFAARGVEGAEVVFAGLDEAGGEGCEGECAGVSGGLGRVRLQRGQTRLMGCRTIEFLRVGYAAPFM